MTRLGGTDIAWPRLAEIIAVLTLQAGYNTVVVMIGVTILGLAAGTVGTFAVLRKRALMSDTLSHATLPGIALAFLTAIAFGAQGRSLPVLLSGAVVSAVLGVLIVQFIVRNTRLPVDAAMGAVLSVFFGLGFVLLSYIQRLGTGAEGGISKFIYGQTAAMSVGDAQAIACVATGSAIAAALLFKEFRLVCFDPEFAAAQGWPISVIDVLMMALIVLVTVIGLQAVGLILIVALIIIPPAAARFWTERLWVMTLIAAGIGALSGYIGAALSALLPRFPAGGIIVLVAGVFFLLSLFFAPARGVVAAIIRRQRLQLQIGSQHVLRGLYEATEAGRLPPGDWVPSRSIRAVRAWSALRRSLVLFWLETWGLIARRNERLRLTEAGQLEAIRLTRNHRLWEEFLVSHAELAPSHVDRSADLVEHVLDRDMVAKLERQLAAVGRLPRSVHPIQAPDLRSPA